MTYVRLWDRKRAQPPGTLRATQAQQEVMMTKDERGER